MLTNRQIFLQNIGQTCDYPSALEIEKALGIYMYDKEGKDYIDLVSGVSVSNVGHRHPRVVETIKEQLDKHMHLMVYGEFVQYPQVKFAELLNKHLPENLNNIYYVNSGSEANEGAMKLAKRYTGRTEIVTAKNGYHGSTHGALSVMGDEKYKRPFRPLLPDIKYIEFNNPDQLDLITEKTACVIIEPIQAEAGIILPEKGYLEKLREKCNATGTILIFDEVQTGFGRTGQLFAFQKYGITPDIVTIAKGMGGGMPIGAFISSKNIMDALKIQPGLGHITTFGGHPVSAAAAYENLRVILEEKMMEGVEAKEKQYKKKLKHSRIKNVRGTGLFLAVELQDENTVNKTMKNLREEGIITDQFIFKPNAFRIAPPLIIAEEEIDESIQRIKKALDKLDNEKN
ncbi:MAG: aspartate aminotransferase family protein [Bacteroidales bacterium]